MGDELESYKLEWVVTSSSPVVQFRAEWKMLGKKGEWQSQIVEVSQKSLLTTFSGFLGPPFFVLSSPQFDLFSGEEGWS